MLKSLMSGISIGAGCSDADPPHGTRPCRGRLSSGSQLQQLAGGALDFEALVVVRDRPRVRGGGDRHVPKGLDRALFLDLMDGLDRLHHAAAEPLGEKSVQIVLDAL